MGFLSKIFSPITAITGTVNTVVENRTKLKEAQIKADAAVTKARTKAIIDAYKEGRMSEAMLDQLAVNQMDRSWKDEYLTLVLTAPFIGAFIGALADDVQAGFEILQLIPDWWKAAWAIVFSTSFGVRKYGEVMISRAYSAVHNIATK